MSQSVVPIADLLKSLTGRARVRLTTCMDNMKLYQREIELALSAVDNGMSPPDRAVVDELVYESKLNAASAAQLVEIASKYRPQRIPEKHEC